MTDTTIPNVTLTDVLAYQHPGIVRRYAKDHGASLEEAEEVFREMLKWLYLCYRSATDGAEDAVCVMTPDIEKIDWMWHTFLLFTRDYADFCEHYFGFFVHHIPNEEEEDKPLEEAVVREQLEKQYTQVYNALGEKTLLTWYDDCRYAVQA